MEMLRRCVIDVKLGRILIIKIRVRPHNLKWISIIILRLNVIAWVCSLNTLINFRFNLQTLQKYCIQMAHRDRQIDRWADGWTEIRECHYQSLLFVKNKIILLNVINRQFMEIRRGFAEGIPHPHLYNHAICNLFCHSVNDILIAVLCHLIIIRCGT